ncbi:MAG: hypothetical protein PGMFKBFP_00802 [Anaerolineales bacterium]|nr:hypothetical protein [Anaerolineales bacterium]
MAADRFGELYVDGRIFAVEEFDFEACAAEIVVNQRGGAVDFVQPFVWAGGDRRDTDQLPRQVQDLGCLIGIGDFDHGLSPREERDGRLLGCRKAIPCAGGFAAALDEFADLDRVRAEGGVIGGDALHVRFHLRLTLVEQFFEKAQRRFVPAEFGLQSGADLLGGVASALGHLDEGMEVIPQVESLRQRFDLAQRPLEEGAHGDGFARQRVLDLGAQAELRGEPFVGAGAADVLAVVAEGARKARVGVDAEEQEMFEGQVGDVEVETVAALVGADFDASHREVDARHQVLLFDLQRHLFGRSRLADGEQASGVERGELVARRGDDAFDGFGERAGADGSPVVVPEADAAPHEVVGDLQVIVVGAVEVGQVNGGGIREGQVADRVELGQGDDGASVSHLRLHGRGRAGRDEETGEGAQEARSGDVEFGLEAVEVTVAALAGGQVHEVPGEERVGQGQVGVDARGGEGVAVEVHAFFEIAAFGDGPLARDGVVTDGGEEEQVAVPVVQTLAEVEASAVQRVDEGGFHQARFVDGAARTVVGTRRPFDHPVEDFELAELRLPGGDALGAQVVHEGLLAGSRADGEQRTQVGVEEVPFLLEAVEPARRLFFDGLFDGEEVFVGELGEGGGHGGIGGWWLGVGGWRLVIGDW